MTETIVTTTTGAVRGATQDDVRRYLGIPYAASPTGALRFAKPQPYPAWNGVRDATRPGPSAPQPAAPPFEALDIEPLVGSGWRHGDDFLNISVWAPEAPITASPVLVFIHGGGFIAGSNDVAVLDGSAFARSGVICMAINYRMGIEGFLAIPGVPTNLGLRDQIVALEWVRDNAAAFGGDPTDITVFGESAGAMSVADLIASPLAKGLFRRAIVQSGHGGMTRSLPVARRLAAKLAKMLRVTPDEAGFRGTTIEQGVAALAKVQRPTARVDLREANGQEPAFGLSRFLPVHGDDVLPLPPLEALAGGIGREVDLLIGTNLDEMNIYLVPTGVRAKIGRLVSWCVLGRSVRGAGKTLKAYGMGKRRAGDALAEAMTDLAFRLPARDFAVAHAKAGGRTHFYEFGWRSPAFAGALGAAHALELPFVFDTLASCTGPKGLVGLNPPQALADSIHRLWVDFARGGTLPWPAFDGPGGMVYALETGRAQADAPIAAAALRSEADNKSCRSA
jgi:para-nitrobenzyl esterase